MNYLFLSRNFAIKLQGNCWKDDVVTFTAPSERNYQTFYKMQEKVVLAAILEGKSMPSKIDYEQSLFFLGPSSKSPETPLYLQHGGQYKSF